MEMKTELPGARREGATSLASLAEGRANLGRGGESPPHPGFFYSPWTPEHKALLTGMASAGKTVHETARALDRTLEATRAMAKQLKTTFKWTPPEDLWPSEKTAVLTVLWSEGHTASEIGRRMGITKNAALGRVHRLDLPGRQGPKEIPRKIAKAEIIAARQEWRGCLYMTGDPKDSDWSFCQKPGSPWCDEHKEKVFLKPGQVGGVFRLPNLTTLDK